MKKHIPAFALIILAICLVPAGVFAAHKDPAGHKAIRTALPKVTEDQLEDKARLAEGLPEKLDPRQEAWFKDNIRVRDQADTELCWAFSATSAAQISYVTETYDPEDPKTVPELSPAHLGFFFYNRVDDPLGNTAGDRNCLTVSDSWKDDGGANYYSFQHLASWSGPGPEAATPFKFDPVRYEYTGPDQFDSSLAYSNALTLQNSEIYAELPATQAGLDTIKNMIVRYGAVVGAVCWDDEYLNLTEEDQQTFFDPYEDQANHEVTIIGWDDSFRRENFAAEDGSEGSGDAAETPQRDGAWLVLNSWGDDVDGGGYFWLSYESGDYLTQGILGMDMQEVDPKLSLYQYDGTAIDGMQKLSAGDVAANVFTAPESHQILLKNVGFTTWNTASSTYTLKIYTDLTDKNRPSSGTLQASQTLTTDSPGYKTFALDSPVTIDAGGTFAVSVTCKEANAFGKEMSDYYFEDGEKIDTTVAQIQPGQSFRYSYQDKSWYDCAKAGTPYCLRIKAMTEDIECIHDYQQTGRVEPQKGVAGYITEECSLCGHILKTAIPALDPRPEPTKITKLVRDRKAMTVKWKKSTEKIAGKNIDGYQIRYSLKKTMNNYKKVTVKGYKLTSKKIKKLKAKKKYYVQIRTYKKTSGKNWYSSWSVPKAVKTK